MKEEEKIRLKKLLRELERVRGRHTELVSVYIPAGYNLAEILNQLNQERGTAANIKSKATRKNVIAALEKIIQYLKKFRQTPPNGLAIFCGNVSREEGKSDIRLWVYEPPVPLNKKIYWCDQTFVLEPLKEMLEEKEVYGLIVLDAREAMIGILKGKKVEALKRMESTVPSKSVKGGMSQRRYDRIREDALNEFLRKVAENASSLFLEMENLKGIIIGGPGPVKEKFYREQYLHYQLQKKVLGVKDVGYTGEFGLQELVERSQDLLKEAAIGREREILWKFFSELKNEGKVVYGYDDVKKALDAGAVDVLLISEAFDWRRVKLRCECGFETTKEIPKRLVKQQHCPNCGKRMRVEDETPLVDEIVEKAQQMGSKVEYISVETSEGRQFKELGGLGAFLRFKLS